MKRGSFLSLRVATLRGVVFAAVLVGGLAFPAGLGGFTAQYVWIAAGGALLLLTQRLRLRPEAVLLGGSFAALGLVSAILAPELWFVREYVRVVLFVYLLLVVDEPTRGTVLRAIMIAIFAGLTFDFVVLYMLELEAFDSLLYQRGMQSFTGHYGRHVGFLGNPNSSAAFYAIVFVSGTAAFLSGAVRSRTRKAYVAFCMGVSLILLGATLSRTAILATAGAVLGMVALRIHRLRTLLVGIAFLSFVVVAWFLDLGGLQQRFASTSSLLERISIWRSLLGSMSGAGVIVGGWGEAPVVDNDLIYFLHNFGVLGAITNYLVVLILMTRLWAAGLRTAMVGYAVIVAVLGAGMGFFVDPKFALLIFSGCVLVPPRSPTTALSASTGEPPPRRRPSGAARAAAVR